MYIPAADYPNAIVIQFAWCDLYQIQWIYSFIPAHNDKPTLLGFNIDLVRDTSTVVIYLCIQKQWVQTYWYSFYDCNEFQVHEVASPKVYRERMWICHSLNKTVTND